MTTQSNTQGTDARDAVLATINFLALSCATYSELNLSALKKNLPKGASDLELTLEILNQIDLKLRKNYLEKLAGRGGDAE